MKNLRAMENQPLYKLVEAINRDLRLNGYSQQPCCEGARKSLLFMA